MKVLRTYFLNLLLREKILLVGFVLVFAIWWFSSFAGRAGRFARDFHHTSEDLAAQRDWLARRDDVDAASKHAIAQLDPARTLDATALQGVLNTLAASLPNNTIDARPDERTDQFAVHTVQFSVHKAEWSALQRFYVELGKRAPYISIEQCSLIADRANPAQLNATMQISSVEIAR
jgi:hypothetical protein